jgi:DNA-binding NtrC family response regulator
MMIKDMQSTAQPPYLRCLHGRQPLSEERIRKIVMVLLPGLHHASMRENRGAIPQLASLYISTLNMLYAKEIIGLEPEGLRLLENYGWPNNYDQFKRILNELVLETDTPFIRTEAIQNLLRREIRMFGESGGGGFALRRDMTLEEIDLSVLKQALAQEHGNQSAVAKRLGISRTTLWRMLQKCVDTEPSGDGGPAEA